MPSKIIRTNKDFTVSLEIGGIYVVVRSGHCIHRTRNMAEAFRAAGVEG